jgi:putative transposase
MIAQIQQETPSQSVRQLCKLLDVNRHWYYKCRKQHRRAEADEKLRVAIEPIVLEFADYGYRWVTQALVRDGWSVNHKRVLRVMREASLLCRKKRRFVYTIGSQHPYQVYPSIPTKSIRIWSRV